MMVYIGTEICIIYAERFVLIIRQMELSRKHTHT